MQQLEASGTFGTSLTRWSSLTRPMEDRPLQLSEIIAAAAIVMALAIASLT